ncbi:MAG: hypothetical protein A3D15_02640 [Alphaproteobacteria bacterium RIFCSPHIGHO2_02_FULL_40_34]|nr:MAG: hypothetical protein A3D15_02640 [Alphaproteobacteria bacterium RIFCSPHIGHO2_02_FULL_40_34]OFX10712.1 MAG: hypothetical protein A3G22_03325 [Alphaproteobacteria bacterium RIFCSPLOWO2_12_FULL_40_11]
MKKFFVVISLCLFSCVQKNDTPKIRIVDLEGKPRPVATKIPELNVAALASQGISQGISQETSWGIVQNDRNFTPVKREKNPEEENNKSDFGAASSQIVQQTLQPQLRNKETTYDESILAAGPVAEDEQIVEYDLSQDEEKKKTAIKKPTKKIAVKKTAKTAGGKFYVQLGSFTNRGNADNLLIKTKKFHSGKVEIVEGEKTIYRVWLGPFSNRAKANAMVVKVKKSGHDAILVKDK